MPQVYIFRYHKYASNFGRIKCTVVFGFEILNAILRFGIEMDATFLPLINNINIKGK